MKRKLMAILPIILLGASSLVAQRTGFSLLPRKLRVINDSPQDIAVRIVSDEGESTFRVSSDQEDTYRWHRGALNVKKIFVRPDMGSRFGRGSEDEIIIPTPKRGKVLPSIRLTYRGLGDYDFSTSFFRKWRSAKKARPQIVTEESTPAVESFPINY